MDNNNLTGSFSKKLGCWIAIRLAKFIPVLLVGTIIGYAYYAYIFQICFYTITCLLERTIYMSLFHVILFLFLCSYYRTVFAETKKVPNLFKLPDDIKFQVKTASNEQEKLLAIVKHGLSLPVKTRTFIGGMLTVRYCPHCEHIKPDRTHHCRICSTCVLKMDHHCPWINNCVSFSNYKYFILFLFYALLFCVYVMITSFPYFIQAWQNYVMAEGKIHIVFLFVIAAMFSISMLSIFTYHIYLISKNTTTLEACRTPIFVDGISHKTPYSRGFVSNLKEVFGSNAFLWLLPVYTSKGDGVQFRMVGEEDSLCGSAADNPLLHV